MNVGVASFDMISIPPIGTPITALGMIPIPFTYAPWAMIAPVAA